MHVINNADKLLLQLLGKQKNKKSTTRPLKWTIKLPVNGGIILHNFLTGETLVFKNEDEISDESEYLYSHYFFVPQENDDLKLVEELRAVVRLINKKDCITSYKILTTTDCNARCSYCYELGMKRESMSLATADCVVKYIIKKSGGKKVTLSWFGGEPLLNVKIIDYICSELKRTGVEYVSVLTSNGFFFTPEMVERAADDWRLSNVQITLDGTRQNYNRIKAYVSAGDDPYTRVINNILALSEKGIRVNIRLNMSLDSYEDHCKLAEELNEVFGGNDRISVYASGIFQETESNDFDLKKKLYACLGKLNEKLREYGLFKKNKSSMKLRAAGCMADKDSHIGISPTGKLIKCEHHIFDMITGDIFLNQTDTKVTEKWKERLSYDCICSECPALPTCYKLKNCPVSHICTEEEKQQYIGSLKQALESQLTFAFN